jgi:hypothetical protein
MLLYILKSSCDLLSSSSSSVYKLTEFIQGIRASQVEINYNCETRSSLKMNGNAEMTILIFVYISFLLGIALQKKKLTRQETLADTINHFKLCSRFREVCTKNIAFFAFHHFILIKTIFIMNYFLYAYHNETDFFSSSFLFVSLISLIV